MTAEMRGGVTRRGGWVVGPFETVVASADLPATNQLYISRREPSTSKRRQSRIALVCQQGHSFVSRSRSSKCHRIGRACRGDCAVPDLGIAHRQVQTHIVASANMSRLCPPRQRLPASGLIGSCLSGKQVVSLCPSNRV